MGQECQKSVSHTAAAIESKPMFSLLHPPAPRQVQAVPVMADRERLARRLAKESSPTRNSVYFPDRDLRFTANDVARLSIEPLAPSSGFKQRSRHE